MDTALDGNRQLKETLSPNEYWCLMWSVDHISKIPVLAQKTSDRPTRSVHTPQNPQASQIGPEPGAFQDEQMEKTSRPRDEHGPSAETFEKTEAPQTALIQAGDKISGIPHRNLTDTMNQSNLAPGTEARGLEASSIPAFHDGVGSCQTPRPSQRSGSQETRAAPGGSYLDNKPVTRDNAHSARTSAPPLQLGSQASSNPPRDPRLKPVSSNPPLQLGSQAPSNLPRDPRLKPVSSNKAWNSRRGRRGRGGY